MDINKIKNIAINASQKAYAPYSNFYVGVVLVTKNEKIYNVAIVENL